MDHSFPLSSSTLTPAFSFSIRKSQNAFNLRSGKRGSGALQIPNYICRCYYFYHHHHVFCKVPWSLFSSSLFVTDRFEARDRSITPTGFGREAQLGAWGCGYATFDNVACCRNIQQVLAITLQLPCLPRTESLFFLYLSPGVTLLIDSLFTIFISIYRFLIFFCY